MSEKDDAKISKLLKGSPKLTPPESFYRGVLEKIERKSGRAEEGISWYWGYPAKALATACVLMVIVLVAREKKTTEPMVGPMEPMKQAAVQNESRPAPAPKAAMFSPNSLAETPQVQERLNRSITGYVKNPSPIEEIDEEERHAKPVAVQADAHQPAALQSKAFEGIRAKDGPFQSRIIQKGFEISGPAAAREILQKIMPVYPEWAMDQKVTGTVSLYVIVSPEGTVNSQVRITQTTGYPALDQTAIDAVKKWKFAPTSETSWGLITLHFTHN